MFQPWKERPLLQGAASLYGGRGRGRQGRGGRGQGPPCHFEFLLKVLKWNHLSLIHLIIVIAADKFSHNCKIQFLTKPECHVREHFPVALTKETDAQFPLVELKQVKY